MRGLRRDPERVEIHMLRRHIPIAGARVLEIGCGSGRLTRRFAGAAHSVVSIDPIAADIAQANRLTPEYLRKKVQFEVGSGEALNFPDQSFQVAVLSWSL